MGPGFRDSCLGISPSQATHFTALQGPLSLLALCQLEAIWEEEPQSGKCLHEIACSKHVWGGIYLMDG